jgi:hypothetical protein
MLIMLNDTVSIIILLLYFILDTKIIGSVQNIWMLVVGCPIFTTMIEENYIDP